MIARRVRVFSRLEVESAREGRSVYGLRRYETATNESLDVGDDTPCLARHIWTSAHAPRASANVHSSDAMNRELGMIVENMERYSGEW